MNQKKTLKGTLIVLAAAVFLALIALIPSVHSASEEDLRAQAEAEAQICYGSYEVQMNDSLLRIAGEYAESYGVSRDAYVKLLREINHLKSDRIITGQRLIVPYRTR